MESIAHPTSSPRPGDDGPSLQGDPVPSLRFHYFFDLPLEIRLQILTDVCHAPEGYYVHILPCMFVPGMFARIPTEPLLVRVPWNLFLASVQLYQEASAVFYETNTFHITLPSKRKAYAPLTGWPNALFAPNSAALTTRRRMRSVTLWYVASRVASTPFAR